ncbi:MAG: two-component regulator propeller domain-containing protein [Rhizomicrobium sp.]
MRNLRAPARVKARYIALAIALGAILISPRAASADANRTIRGYVHTAWTLADGAPPDVWALAQSPDGYLWLGTGAGLYRFDGIHFERVKPTAGDAFPSTDVTNLLASPNGDIWIGYQNGGRVSSQERQAEEFFRRPIVTVAKRFCAGCRQCALGGDERRIGTLYRWALADHWTGLVASPRLGVDPVGYARPIIVDDNGSIFRGHKRLQTCLSAPRIKALRGADGYGIGRLDWIHGRQWAATGDGRPTMDLGKQRLLVRAARPAVTR